MEKRKEILEIDKQFDFVQTFFFQFHLLSRTDKLDGTWEYIVSDARVVGVVQTTVATTLH